MGFFDFIKRVGRVVSTPFRALGNVVVSGAKKLIGSLAEAGRQGGVSGVIKKIGSGILEGAKKVSELPIIQDTPLGRIAKGITMSDALGKAVQSGDVGEALKAGKDIAGELKGLRRGGR